MRWKTLSAVSAGGQVDVSLFVENGQAVLLVEDSGCGIPEAELQQVFEPFYRVGSAPSREWAGAGDQSGTAKRLGAITLSNRPQGGLVFGYRQPAQPIIYRFVGGETQPSSNVLNMYSVIILNSSVERLLLPPCAYMWPCHQSCFHQGVDALVFACCPRFSVAQLGAPKSP